MADEVAESPRKTKIIGGPSITSTESKGKSVTLTFTTEAESKVYAAFASAAEADDRSISSFMVRFLLGKEENPISVSE